MPTTTDTEGREAELRRKASYHDNQAELYAEASFEQCSEALSSAYSALSEAHQAAAAALRESEQL